MKTKTVSRDALKLHEMPKSHSTIRVSRQFSAGEIERIKLGFRPGSMNDRWFIFYERDLLHIHRSWTGYCIYVLRFEKKGRHYLACELRANRNPQQYLTEGDYYDEQMAFWIIDFILLGHMDARMPQSL